MSKITSKLGIEEIATIVCQALRDAEIDVVLTGGAVVSIYSNNQYESWDLDFVQMTPFKKVDEVMTGLGFNKDKGRHFNHPNSKIFVEFPGSVLAIGETTIKDRAERKSRHGVLCLLAPTECVMDRLAAYYHWNDQQGLDQAVMVARKHPVNLSKVEKWSEREGMKPKFQKFFGLLKREQP